jgi:fatty acid desaturase
MPVPRHVYARWRLLTVVLVASLAAGLLGLLGLLGGAPAQAAIGAATGPTAAFPLSQEPGVADWKELEAAGKTSTYYYDQTTKSTWIYDGTNFWSIETPDLLRFSQRNDLRETL